MRAGESTSTRRRAEDSESKDEPRLLTASLCFLSRPLQPRQAPILKLLLLPLLYFLRRTELRNDWGEPHTYWPHNRPTTVRFGARLHLRTRSASDEDLASTTAASFSVRGFDIHTRSPTHDVPARAQPLDLMGTLVIRRSAASARTSRL
jgi:hypothetical protein